MSKQLINRLMDEFKDPIGQMGYELLEVEFVRESGDNFLRFYIYKDEGIDVDDCEKVSLYIDPILDDLDMISSSYYLEVCSPDLSRPLKSDRDLERNLSNLLDIFLYAKRDNKKEFRGYLTSFDDETLTLDVDGKKEIFNRKDVSKITVAIVF